MKNVLVRLFHGEMFIVISAVLLCCSLSTVAVAEMLPSPQNLRFGEAAAGIKWYPGHYVYLSKSSDIPITMTQAGGISAFRGIQRAYFWEELEPTKDNYDFSVINNDIKTLQGSGKYLVIQLQYKTFSKNPKVPAYLKTSEYEGGVYWGINQYNIRLWNSRVRERLSKLIIALSQEFDDDPSVVLFNLPESGPAKPSEADEPILFQNWSDHRRRYFEGLFQVGALARENFKNTPVIMYFNDGVIAEIESTSRALGIGVGAPDTILSVFLTIDGKKSFFAPYYSLIQQSSGRVPTSLAAQWPNWDNAITRQLVPDPLKRARAFYEMNRDVIGVNFMFWERVPDFWDSVLALWRSLSTDYPNDPAGGLSRQCPELVAPCLE